MRLLQALLLLMVLPLSLPGCLSDEPEATATLRIDFGGQHPDGMRPIETEIGFDPDSRPSGALYVTRDVMHPTNYTVHDLMVQWADEGGNFQTSYFSGLGYSLDSVEGLASTFSDVDGWFWQLSINGVASTKGMSTAVVEGGDVVAWTYTYTTF